MVTLCWHSKKLLERWKFDINSLIFSIVFFLYSFCNDFHPTHSFAFHCEAAKLSVAHIVWLQCMHLPCPVHDTSLFIQSLCCMFKTLRENLFLSHCYNQVSLKSVARTVLVPSWSLCVLFTTTSLEYWRSRKVSVWIIYLNGCCVPRKSGG